MLKAIVGLAEDTVAGLDGFPIEVFRNLSAALLPAPILFRCIWVLDGYPCPRYKPDKDPMSRQAKRPISLIYFGVRFGLTV